MAQIPFPMWGACPVFSKVIPPKEMKIFDPSAPPPQPETLVAHCLGPACGFWKVTKTKEEGGRVVPVEGLCGVRFLGEVFNSIAGSLEQLVRMNAMKEVREGASSIFGAPPHPPEG